MLMIFEKGIRGGMCQASHRYVKANFKWIDDLSMFTEDFIKGYNEESDITCCRY